MAGDQRTGGWVVRRAKAGVSWRGSLIAAVIILMFWLVAALASAELGRVATALFFVFGVILAGTFGGLAAALYVSTAAFLLYNFHVAEPVLSFKLNTGRDFIPLLAFTLCAVVAGLLAGQLKDRAQAADLSNSQLVSLLEVSQALQSAVRVSDIMNILNHGIMLPIASTINLFLVRDGSFQGLEMMATQDPGLLLAQRGRHTANHASQDGSHLAYRLESSEGFEGVLLFETSGIEPLESSFMSALANLTALAVERAALSESNAERRAQARTEELKTALLSSVSHDFRTPLTAISASASSLIDFHEKLDSQATFKLLRGIVSECERLNRYTANLLEMSRLESGQALARCQNLAVADTLSALIQRTRPRAGNRKIDGRLGSDRLLVHVDTALFELVFVNVLENAITYSDDGTRISVDVRAEGGHCAIIIADQGQGIPQADLSRVFERFYRVHRAEPSPRGSGLGLAIAKGFVEALGGQISASTPGIDGRGTAVTILLPTVREVASNDIAPHSDS